MLKNGDPSAPEVAKKRIASDLQGKLSNNPLRGIKYTFCCGAALASRICMEGGLDEERAQNVTDLFISRMDICETREEVIELFGEMFSFLVKETQELRTAAVYSKPIVESIEYVYDHLHEPIHIAEVADAVHLNASYLSTLFHKETGETLSDYILASRIEEARRLLKYSQYTYLEISEYLAFNSQSHFIRQFKKATGYTPKEEENI